MNARCGHCGSTVMSYRRYVFQWTRTAMCQHSCRRVRLRGYGALVTGSVLMLAVFAALILVLHSSVARALVAAALVAFAVALDWWSWHALSWIPLAPQGEGPAAGPPPAT